MDQNPLAEWAHATLESEEAALTAWTREAYADFLQAEHSHVHAHRLCSALTHQRRLAAIVADSADVSQHDEAPVEVKAEFMEHFRYHMPTLSGCRHRVSPDAMNWVVNQLCQRHPPISWGMMTGIIKTFLDHLEERVDQLDNVQRNARARRDQLGRESMDLRRQAYIFRSTCRKFWYDQSP